MKRGAALAAVVAVLGALGAGDARAQDDGPRTAVVGGGSFNAAPLIEPGRYRDTILPDEYLYYGIALQAGQRLRVRARIPDADAETWTDAIFGFAINLHGPLRERLVDAVDEDAGGNGAVALGPVSEENVDDRLAWDFYGPRALALADSGARSEFQGAGTWYVSFNGFTRGQDQLAEFPVEFELEVDGAPVAEAPDPTPAPTRTPAPTAAAPGEEEDGGGGLAPVLVLGAVGLLAGLVLGGVLGRRRD